MLTSNISTAAKLLQDGEVVAFPTETVYGLGAIYNNPNAIKKIFEIKGRPQNNPLIVHIANLEQLNDLISEPVKPEELRLIETFWPGPLTLIFKKHPNVSQLITGGLDTVAIRMPNNHIARELIHLTGAPLVAPSANPSGKPSPTHHNHIQDYYSGAITCLKGGYTKIGLESTILMFQNGSPTILRWGAISPEEISSILGTSVQDYENQESKRPIAPGMAYRHYAPNAKLQITSSVSEIQDLIDNCEHQDKLGLMLSSNTLNRLDIPKGVIIKSLGDKADLNKVSSLIYRYLIDFDASDVGYILTETFPKNGLGMAIMDKLKKASQAK